MIRKHSQNPLLIPGDIVPSRPDFRVDGVFNCGVTKLGEEYLLLLRVAESFADSTKDCLKFPIVVKEEGRDVIKAVSLKPEEHPELDFSDSRSVWQQRGSQRKIVYLTSLSHFRLARSKNGVDFEVDAFPTIMPRAEDEEWGIEDPRITKIDDNFYITYTAVSRYGAATAMIQTEDFVDFKRLGIIFAPENKDVTIFPQKINGVYWAFNRPVPSAIGEPDMWTAQSPDLIHWGKQEHFYGVSSGSDSWENGRIGGGAVPFLTHKGWVKIYHAADQGNRYCLGAFLLDKDDPRKIIGHTKQPILEPSEKYETEGFFANVVFTCGCLVEEDSVLIYYGAADDKVCLAELSLQELLKELAK